MYEAFSWVVRKQEFDQINCVFFLKVLFSLGIFFDKSKSNKTCLNVFNYYLIKINYKHDFFIHFAVFCHPSK